MVIALSMFLVSCSVPGVTSRSKDTLGVATRTSSPATDVPSGNASRDTSAPRPGTRTSPAPGSKPDTLRGTVLCKPWGMTDESYRAGGGEYYVLKTASPIPQDKRSAVEGVILRPSKSVAHDDFGAYVGKVVEVYGVYDPGIRWRPPPDYPGTYALPTKDASGTEVWPIRFDGFVAYRIKRLPSR
jgi:hypothetical protein